MLTKRGGEILVRIERMMDEANRALGPLPSTASIRKQQAAAPNAGDALASALEGRAFERN